MVKGDYSRYVGKSVMNIVSHFSTFGKVGIVEETDEYGALTIKWDNPTEDSGEKGFLFANEVQINGK